MFKLTSSSATNSQDHDSPGPPLTDAPEIQTALPGTGHLTFGSKSDAESLQRRLATCVAVVCGPLAVLVQEAVLACRSQIPGNRGLDPLQAFAWGNGAGRSAKKRSGGRSFKRRRQTIFLILFVGGVQLAGTAAESGPRD